METRRRARAALLAALLLAGACAGADEPGAPRTAEGPEATSPDEESTGADPTDDLADDDRSTPEDEPTGDEPSGDDPDAAPADDPEPFEDAAALAEALGSAETALVGGAEGEDLARWTAVHQRAYRQLALRPEWREPARDAVPAELRDAYDLTLHGVEELVQLTEPVEELPDWRIEAPPPVDDLRAHYDAAETEFDVPWSVLAAIHLIETRFGRIHGDSSAGAQGPMQFMPGTWEQFGEGDVHDPRDAIMAAGRYLAASGAAEDLEAAVFAYNRSDHYVKAVLAHAEAMEAHDHYLDVYHGWQVYYRTVDGDVVLEEGYGS